MKTPDKECKRIKGEPVFEENCYKIKWTNIKGESWVTPFGWATRERAVSFIETILKEQWRKAK